MIRQRTDWIAFGAIAATLVVTLVAAAPTVKHSEAPLIQKGWVRVALSGSPSAMGRQHGIALATQIQDLRDVVRLELTHDTGKDYDFFRTVAQQFYWPKVDPEYQAEITGIVEGARLKGAQVDVWDLVIMNAALELSPNYGVWWQQLHGGAMPKPGVPGDHCSAFVAVGKYTRDGKPVIAHNNWTSYLDGARWNIIFDVQPARGNHFLMDGMPGLIHSGDDFGVTSSGLAITETTIGAFKGFDKAGVPEFVRARKAMQYANNIDDFNRLMRQGNNGGYANNWLVVDNKNGEIASLELGLRHVTLQRTKDGYFVGSNFPVDSKLMKEETDFEVDKSLSPNARRIRAEYLMETHKGKIDVDFARQFVSDHWDSFENREQASERTLCGHIDVSPRGYRKWLPPYSPGGAVQAKVADSRAIAQLSFDANMGHSCGRDFSAKEHLAAHPEFAWMQPLLRDLKSFGWTTVAAR